MNDSYWYEKNFAIEQSEGKNTVCSSCNKDVIGAIKTLEKQIPIMCKECFVRICEGERNAS